MSSGRAAALGAKHAVGQQADARLLERRIQALERANRDLEAIVVEGAFRAEDMKPQPSVTPLKLPPLRERRDDILPAAERLLTLFARQYGRPARRFGRDAAMLLREHGWPGDLRELRNAVERAVIVCEGDTVGAEHLPFGNNAPVSGGIRCGDPVSLAELERAHIERIIASAPSLEAAARLLGIDSSTLYRKRIQYDMR
jgi:NtrC-family two-component system response regulator AlgB